MKIMHDIINVCDYRGVKVGWGLLVLLCTLASCSTSNDITGLWSYPGGSLEVDSHGSVYRSNDSGKNWFQARDDPGVNVLLWTFTNEGWKGFAGTEISVKRSIDEGKSWQQLGGGLPSSLWVQALAASGDTVYTACNLMSSDEGLFRSTNGGDSWQKLQMGDIGNRILSLSAGGPIVLLSTGFGLDTVYRSTDAGITWAPLKDSIHNRLITSFARVGGAIYAGSIGNVFISTNQGLDWRRTIGTGLPPHSIVTQLAFSEGFLFAGTFNSGLYRSTDEGDHWEKSQLH